MALTTRWEVERAVYGSTMEPAARFILVFILSKSQQDTAFVDAPYVPRFEDIAKATGFSKSTVGEWMAALKDAKWFEREDKPRNVAAGYQMRVGEDSVARTFRASRISKPKEEVNPPGGLTEPHGAGAANAETADSGTRQGELLDPLGGVAQPAGRGDVTPPSGLADDAPIRKNSSTKSSTTTTTSNTAADEQPPGDDEAEAGKKPKKAKKAEPYREDVDILCRRLVEWIVRNGSIEPKINDEWRIAARLLLDEKRTPQPTVEKVLLLIDWCQQDDFWKGNIRSMPTFRKQYDAVRLKALAEWNRTKANGGYPSNGAGYTPQQVNFDDPNHRANAWKARAERARQQ